MDSKFCRVFFMISAFMFSITFSDQQNEQKVLLVSFDGFRWDYIYKVPTPHFDFIMDHGVYVKQVTNVLVTTTYPNHYTLVTGLYPESHGIIANDMYDSIRNKTFSLEDMKIYDSEFWEDAVPIWITNQIAGHDTGAAMWPGTDVKIHEEFPTYYMPYNESVSFEDRVTRLLQWFKLKKPINLGLLYWEDPDEMGHNLGPDNPLMDSVISDIDSKLGYLIRELINEKLWNNVNLIITSDHGMTQCSGEKIIELDQYVDPNDYFLVDHSPVRGILPKKGKFDEIYAALKNAHPNLTVYKKEDVPERFHYKHHHRIQPILIMADKGWTIIQNTSKTFMLGNHGYDNEIPDMHPLFLAHGPAFKKNVSKASMNSTDLYPLLCHILDITPMPHNGSLANVEELLSFKIVPKVTPHSMTTPQSNVNPRIYKLQSYAYFVGVFLGSMIVIVFLLVFVKHLTHSQMPTIQERNAEIAQPLLWS
ncbi:ectonucleotide pyrophosphatase/phosphodiesterase family member 5 [Dromiciops gliroides]|uniref:ectonucleotide pyrophosphatase/phosphodiesterase family member 5 n=1 Tax=Dromiciops gliroides TaxID=33562 RepID=UPI001CC5D3F6|nr:ectonucleotide pyrophosphatase/phosphodiesterase family member 5 [Dromiciops gliroides]